MKDLVQLQQPSLQNDNMASKKPKEYCHRIGHYIVGHILGKGGFATVYKGLEVYTKTEVAIKVIELTKLTQKQKSHVKREITIQKNLNHQNIVRIYEVVWTESKVYLFMELVKGTELFEYVSRHGPLRESVAAKIFQQIVQAVGYLHENGVAHRDIKTENIVIDSEFNAKLIDFGLAKQFRTPASHDEFFTTFCGSPSYTSPELLEKKSYSGQMVDIWCLGVTLYVMLEASLPFDQADDLRRKQNIRNLRWHPAVYSSPQANSVYNSIFAFSDHRVTLEEIANSTFLEKYFLTEKHILSQTNGSELSDGKIELDYEIIRQISSFLNTSEDEVRAQIQNISLDPAYCLYKLLANKNSDSKNLNKSVDLNRNSRIASRSEARQISTMIPRNKKSSVRKNSFSSLQKSTMKTLPVTSTDRKSALPKIIKQQKSQLIQIFKFDYQIQRDHARKQSMGARNKYVAKTLISRHLNMNTQKKSTIFSK